MNSNNTRKRGFWRRTLSFACWIIIVYALFACGSLIWIPVRKHLTSQRILRANPVELLNACRSVISCYDEFQNEWHMTDSLFHGDKALVISGNSSRSNDQIDKHIPATILQLKPQDIIVNSNYMFSCHFGRVRILAIGENCDVASLPFAGLLDGNSTFLTNGLWLIR